MSGSVSPARGSAAPALATCQAGSEDEALEEELMDGDESRSWTPQEKALHEARLKAKAKRRLRRTSSRDSTREPAPEGGEPSPDPSSPKGKTNDRKSRMGKGRGLPKKGGAGGKGVWGAPGLVYGYQEPDARDPNYDESSQGDTVYATVTPELEEGELEKNVHPMVLEYFEHGDTLEVMVSLGSPSATPPPPSGLLGWEGFRGHIRLARPGGPAVPGEGAGSR
ncbi:programmed cell death protein 4-like [Terrapene carolina triunguis]|uniref:programmed cell death protein 4-like n=1 Tax=Terrapene triunguis TaxID=2587831 RepID=UPI000E77976C|nr:programmed cell death protein 4-like [Terrapene carolina triunguis]